MASCSHTITGELVTDRSSQRVFTCINQTFILPTMGVLISADISRSSSASYAWSTSIFFTFVRSSVTYALTHTGFFGLDLWKIFEVHIVYKSTGNRHNLISLNHPWQQYWFSWIFVPLQLAAVSIWQEQQHLCGSAGISGGSDGTKLGTAQQKHTPAQQQNFV